MENNIIPEMIEHISYLPYSLQKQVLNYVKELKISSEYKVSGKQLLQFAGSIPPGDLKIMSDAIEKDCGRVDINEW